MSLTWVPLILLVSIFAAAGNTLLKLGAGEAADYGHMSIKNLYRALLRPLVLAGIVVYGLGQILWITELRLVDLSIAYPLQVGINFILITAIAKAHLKEPLTAGKLAGILVIFLGILAIATG